MDPNDVFKHLHWSSQDMQGKWSTKILRSKALQQAKDATRRWSEIHRNKPRMMKCSVNWKVWPFEAENWTVVQEIHHENAPLDLEGHGLNECRLFQTVLTTNQSPNQGSKRELFGNPCYQSESKGLWSRASGLPGTSGNAFYQNHNQRPGWGIALSSFLKHVRFAKCVLFWRG